MRSIATDWLPSPTASWRRPIAWCRRVCSDSSTIRRCWDSRVTIRNSRWPRLVGTDFEGGKNWPEITMWMRAEEEQYNADVMANDIVDQLKQTLGMDVSIQPVPQSNFSEQLFENKWQLVFIRWWYDYPDPDNGYGDMFYSQKNSGKRQAWSNAAVRRSGYPGQGSAHAGRRAWRSTCRPRRSFRKMSDTCRWSFRLDQNVFKPWVQGVAGQLVWPEGSGWQHLRQHAPQRVRRIRARPNSRAMH